MAHHSSQENDHPHDADPVPTSLTPQWTIQANSQQQQLQHLVIHANNNNNVAMASSQAASLITWPSSTSIGSTSSEVREADKLFDQIEDMMREYVREPSRHYLHCRILRWSIDEDLLQQFTAVVVINPPTTQH